MATESHPEHETPVVVMDGDVDLSGNLALAMFVIVIGMLLALIVFIALAA